MQIDLNKIADDVIRGLQGDADHAAGMVAGARELLKAIECAAKLQASQIELEESRSAEIRLETVEEAKSKPQVGKLSSEEYWEMRRKQEEERAKQAEAGFLDKLKADGILKP